MHYAKVIARAFGFAIALLGALCLVIAALGRDTSVLKTQIQSDLGRMATASGVATRTGTHTAVVRLSEDSARQLFGRVPFFGGELLEGFVWRVESVDEIVAEGDSRFLRAGTRGNRVELLLGSFSAIPNQVLVGKAWQLGPQRLAVKAEFVVQAEPGPDSWGTMRLLALGALGAGLAIIHVSRRWPTADGIP